MIDFFALKKASAQRVDQDLHYGEDLAPARTAQPLQRQVTFVVVTGARSSGLWPCKVVSPNGGSFQDHPATCWGWASLSSLPRRPLLALRDGDHTDGKPKYALFDAGEYLRWVKVTSAITTTTGPWSAVLQEDLGSGYVDGAAVKLEIRSGNRFVDGGYYLATFRGETTISSTTYPLFAANGNQRVDLSVCDNGVDKCFAFHFPAPFAKFEIDCTTGAPK